MHPIPLREPTMVSVEFLEFDRENPRFTPDKEPSASSDEAIIQQLSRTADLAELIEAIGSNGYIPIEPMIVFEKESKYIVLEGNRRLAAVRCLRDSDLARRCEVTVPKSLSDEVRRSLEVIMVYRVEDAKSARNLIGFKHINGPQAWDAYAKALYAKRWLDDERSRTDGKGLSLSEISRRMGDKNDTLHRMVTATYVIAQAEEEGIYYLDDRSKRHFSFSHLYTALSYPEFTNYLGMDRPARSEDPKTAPVPRAKFGELRTLLEWLYGSKRAGLEPIIESQAKDLNRLKTVLGHPSALRELTARRQLDDAVTSATPAMSLFAENMIQAAANLRVALENVTGFDPLEQEDLIEVSKNCVERADSINALILRAAERARR